jgi:hypothetical protein
MCIVFLKKHKQWLKQHEILISLDSIFDKVTIEVSYYLSNKLDNSLTTEYGLLASILRTKSDYSSINHRFAVKFGITYSYPLHFS